MGFKVYKSASISHMLHCACYVAWASTLNSPQTLFWVCLLPAYYVSLAHLKRLTPLIATFKRNWASSDWQGDLVKVLRMHIHAEGFKIQCMQLCWPFLAQALDAHMADKMVFPTRFVTDLVRNE